MAIKIDENYPLEIRKLDEKESAEAFKDIKGGCQKFFVRIGPSGYFFNDGILQVASRIYNMELRPDDVFVVTFPKAGTTWTQELVWLVGNNFDYETANKIPLMDRFPFIEISMFIQNDAVQSLIKTNISDKEVATKIIEEVCTDPMDQVNNMPSPRFLKSHLPFSMLPPNILEKTKVVYVARDPRDIVVSYFHHHKLFSMIGYTGEFKDFWELCKNDMVDSAPYFDHLKEAWALKDHPNMLFLFYEELSKDLAGVIRRVAKFLNKKVTEEQVTKLCEHLSFDNFKKNKSVNNERAKTSGLMNPNGHFVRKGKVGDWRNHFDEKMAKEAEQWMADGLRGTDITFTNSQ